MSTTDWQEQYDAAPKRRDRWVTMSFEDLPAAGFPPDGEDAPERIGEPGMFSRRGEGGFLCFCKRRGAIVV